MRLIGPEVDVLGVLQSSEFAGERLLTGISLNYRCRPRLCENPLAASR